MSATPMETLESQWADRIKEAGEAVEEVKKVTQITRDFYEERKKLAEQEEAARKDILDRIEKLATKEQLSDIEKAIAKRRYGFDDDEARKRSKKAVIRDISEIAIGHMHEHPKGINDGGTRLKQVIDRLEKAGPLSTDGTGTGAEFVPTLLSTEIYQLLEDEGTAMSEATRIPMTSMTMDISDPGAVTLAWQSALGGEGTAATDQQPATSKTTLTADTLIATMGLTNQLLRTSSVELVSVYMTRFIRRMSREFEKQILQGTGSPFTGISNVAGAKQTTLGSTKTKPEDVTFPNIADTVGLLSNEALRGAKWRLHPGMIAFLRGVTGSANDHPIFAPPGGPMPATIYGIPYETSFEMTGPTGAAQASKVFMELGNLEHVLLGTVEDMRFDVSQDAAFRAYMAVLRAVMVAGIVIPDGTAFAGIKTAAS